MASRSYQTRHNHPAPNYPAPRRGELPRRGFTFLELLIVVGIIAVLVAILAPVCGVVRQTARDVVCAARLRDLSFASASYLNRHEIYPEPVSDAAPLPAALPPLPPVVVGFAPKPPVLLPMPQNNQTRLLNDLGPYLRFPPIPGGAAAADLPPAVQCPSLEAVEDGRGPLATSDPSNYSYYTGYVYVGGLDDPAAAPPPVSSGVLLTVSRVVPAVALKPGRAAGRRGARAVLWADDVRLSVAPGSPAAPVYRGVFTGWAGASPFSAASYWVFAHARPSAPPGPAPLSTSDPRACRGQHRAYTDNSVDWTKGENLGLDSVTPGLLDSVASFKSGSTYWWY